MLQLWKSAITDQCTPIYPTKELTSAEKLSNHVPTLALGSYHFLAHGGGGGGCGRNGMKDSVKFLIPPGNSRKIVDPPLYL